MSFSIKYGSSVFANKIAEMGDPFYRKLSVNKNFLRKKKFAETMGETALKETDQKLNAFVLYLKLTFLKQMCTIS